MKGNVKNGEAIILFCGGSGAKGEIFGASEWHNFTRLLSCLGLQPCDLLSKTRAELSDMFQNAELADRLTALLEGRFESNAQTERLSRDGIGVVTEEDEFYPSLLAERLPQSHPPLLYYAGELSLIRKFCAGYAGSREPEEDDAAFTESAVQKTAERGFATLSGGARGIDTVAERAGMRESCGVVELPAYSLLDRVRSSAAARALGSGNFLALSAAPSSPFTVEGAMTRNRYIYALSAAAVVIRSGFRRGGTWAGASEALRRGLCPVFCRENRDCAGNMALIARGAVPIGEDWDGDLSAVRGAVQMGLFDGRD